MHGPIKRKKNILFVAGSFYPAIYYGGPIYSSYNLASELSENDLNVHVVTTNANGSRRLKIKTNKYLKIKNNLYAKYYGAACKNGFSPLMFLMLWLDILKADVVYLVSIFSPFTPLVISLCKIFNKSLILYPAGQLGKWCLKQSSLRKKIWLKIVINPFIDRIIWHLNSKIEQEDVNSVFHNARTFVIPVGIQMCIYSSEEKIKKKILFKKYANEINSNSLIIISMGRIDRVKGFDILIKAFKIVKEKYDNCFLIIAGQDYGAKKELLKYTNELKLDNFVYFIGNIEGEEKIDFLKNADLFALPSHHENFGIVYAESLSAGTPIIASKNTPWQDVEKYNCGKWVENTPEDFAEAIINVLDSDYKNMGENGRLYIEEKYNWQNIAAIFKQKLEQIILKNEL